MKLFYAIRIALPELASFSEARRPAEGVTVTPAGRHHITLKMQHPYAKMGLLTVKGNQAARATGAFDVEIKGLGCFPDPVRAEVLWAGIGAGLDKLTLLHCLLPGKENFATYTPHVTLAQFAQPLDASPVVEGMKDHVWGTVRVEGFELLRSYKLNGETVYDTDYEWSFA